MCDRPFEQFFITPAALERLGFESRVINLEELAAPPVKTALHCAPHRLPALRQFSGRRCFNSKSILGGKQNAYQASLNWKPTDYVLFGLNYAHLVYKGGIDIDPTAGVDRDYSVDMVALRSQIDF